MDAVSTWDDLVKQKAQDEANLPMCRCCFEGMYPGEVSIGLGGHMCGWCFEHCASSTNQCRKDPEPVPENQVVMF